VCLDGSVDERDYVGVALDMRVFVSACGGLRAWCVAQRFL
jgi:hypothetical protein